MAYVPTQTFNQGKNKSVFGGPDDTKDKLGGSYNPFAGQESIFTSSNPFAPATGENLWNQDTETADNPEDLFQDIFKQWNTGDNEYDGLSLMDFKNAFKNFNDQAKVRWPDGFGKGGGDHEEDGPSGTPFNIEDFLQNFRNQFNVNIPNVRFPGWHLPPIPDVRSFFPDYHESERERQTRLARALEGTKEGLKGSEDYYRTAATRAGIDPASGSAQSLFGNILTKLGDAEGEIRSADYLASEQARRAREDLSAQIRLGLEQARLGAGGGVTQALIQQMAQMAQLQYQAQLEQIWGPFKALQYLQNFLNPFGIGQNQAQSGVQGTRSSITAGSGDDDSFYNALQDRANFGR